MLAKVLWLCIRVAAHKTMPLARTRRGAPARVSKPWYDQACRDARLARRAVHDCPHSTDEQRLVAEKQYESVVSRSKKRWMQEHNAELVAAAEKVVVFEARRTACVDFVFNGKVVERQDTYRYLGFEFHATQS